MPQIDKTEFDRRWQEAKDTPDVTLIEIEDVSDFDASIVGILKSYVEYAGKGVAEGAITREVYDGVLEHTTAYRKALAEVDPDSTVNAYLEQVTRAMGRRANEDLSQDSA